MISKTVCKNISKCGVICEVDCHAFALECAGCNQLQGQVSWAAFYGKDTCPIFACALSNGYDNCGQCPDVPCKIWFQTRNPAATDEEFEADIRKRLKNLHSKVASST